LSSADEQKRAAGEAAAQLVESGMVVGLGTGSTAVWFVRALGARGLRITCVSTSTTTAELAASLGMTLAELGETKAIDLTVDGADEIGPGLALIKGGGGALLREKLVWEASKRCVVIADAAKSVPALGAFPLPIERSRDGAPVRTDNGNLIYDAACGRIEEPAALAAALKSVTGVVEHGLFLDLADQALIGGPAGVTTLEP
jgi:ribose 5-phosphate isomerase A